MTFDVKHLTETSLHQPCFVVFDILLLNGVLITSKPLKERLKILREIFTPKLGIIMLSKQNEVKTKQQIIEALNKSADKREEGVVYKDLNSVYVPNDRRSGWWKLKLEYFSGMMSDLDAIIMGCDFTSGGKRINGVIVGVSVTTDKDSTPTSYLSLGQIGSGLTIKEWEFLTKQLSPHWVKTEGNNYESSGLKFGKLKPSVWIPPEKSCILVIRASELTRSHGTNPDFKASYTLRFPRIQSINSEKPYYDCLSLLDLNDLIGSSLPVEKLYKKRITLEDIDYEAKKTKKHRARFLNTNVEIEDEVSNILKKHEFYVLSGSDQWKIQDIEKTIKENGGSIVKAEGDNTFCILAGDWHKRLDYYKGSIDVVKINWLQKVLDCQRMYDYEPQDMIYTTTKTKYRFMQSYDKYNDSYTNKATKYSLENVFNNIKEKGDYVCPLTDEINELHRDMKYNNRLNIFQNYMVYFDTYAIINDKTSEVIYDFTLDELLLKFWCGQIAEKIEDSNVIITQSLDIARKEQLLSYIPNGDVRIVDKSFLNEQIEKYVNEIK